MHLNSIPVGVSLNKYCKLGVKSDRDSKDIPRCKMSTITIMPGRCNWRYRGNRVQALWTTYFAWEYNQCNSVAANTEHISVKCVLCIRNDKSNRWSRVAKRTLEEPPWMGLIYLINGQSLILESLLLAAWSVSCDNMLKLRFLPWCVATCGFYSSRWTGMIWHLFWLKVLSFISE